MHTTAKPEGHTAQLEQDKVWSISGGHPPPGDQDGATVDLLLSFV